MSAFNDRIIEDFRANGGVVDRFGSDLVLLHTVGARSGEPRIHPVLSIPQPDGSWLIAASYAGAPTHPAWYFNLTAAPEITIEYGTDTFDVLATDVPDIDYESAWQQFVDRAPGFADYRVKAGARRIPVVRLTRR